jgi:hypothetical protein
MLKRHMSLLYVNCRKFPTNRFVRNFCHSNEHNKDGISYDHYKLQFQLVWSGCRWDLDNLLIVMKI